MDSTEIILLDRLESTHWWYQARKIILLKSIVEFGLPLKVLDLGSASGGNTVSLIDLGCEVTSVEYTDTGAAIQRKKGIPVVQADARSLPFSDEEFDLVICLDVIEHILEEDLVVHEISRVLKRNGRFILSVPEGKKLWSSHDVAVSHVKRYEKPEFAALAQRAGLKIDKIYSRNVFLKPFAIVIRKFRTGSDLGPVPWILNKFLLLIAIIEHKLGTRKICGMTIWLHGRKP